MSSDDDSVWGVLKTTAIQPGDFRPEHNKRLPDALTPRPEIEVEDGDVLITCAGPRARCGVPCLVRKTRPRLMLSGKMYRFRFDERFLDSRYVEAYLLSGAAQLAIDRMKTGGSDSGLNLTQGRFQTLPLPLAPRPEQRRIVAAIEEQFSRLDAAETSLEAVRRRAALLETSILREALDGTWPRVQLSTVVVTLRNGAFVSRPEISAPGVPILRISAVRSRRLALDDVRFAPEGDYSGFYLEPGDLLFTRYSGNPEHVGACARVGAISRATIYPDKLIRVVVDRARVDPSFVELACSTGQTWDEIRSRRKTTAGQVGIAGSQLKTVSIPLPPLEDQQRIVAEVEQRLSVIGAMAASIESAQKRSATLRGAILDRAFRGELVPQDPSDEPASVLLDRIRAERAATAPLKRRRRAAAKEPAS